MPSRRIYETPEDDAKSRALVEFLAARYGWRIIGFTPPLLFCDAVIDTPDGRALLEAKCRDEQWSPFKIKAAKIVQLLEFSRLIEFIPILAVSYAETGKLNLWWPLRAENVEGIGKWGRTDRHDPLDLEASVKISTRPCTLLDYSP